MLWKLSLWAFFVVYVLIGWHWAANAAGPPEGSGETRSEGEHECEGPSEQFYDSQQDGRAMELQWGLPYVWFIRPGDKVNGPLDNGQYVYEYDRCKIFSNTVAACKDFIAWDASDGDRDYRNYPENCGDAGYVGVSWGGVVSSPLNCVQELYGDGPDALARAEAEWTDGNIWPGLQAPNPVPTRYAVMTVNRCFYEPWRVTQNTCITFGVLVDGGCVLGPINPDYEDPIEDMENIRVVNVPTALGLDSISLESWTDGNIGGLENLVEILGESALVAVGDGGGNSGDQGGDPQDVEPTAPVLDGDVPEFEVALADFNQRVAGHPWVTTANALYLSGVDAQCPLVEGDVDFFGLSVSFGFVCDAIEALGDTIYNVAMIAWILVGLRMVATS